VGRAVRRARPDRAVSFADNSGSLNGNVVRIKPPTHDYASPADTLVLSSGRDGRSARHLR